MQQTAPCDRVYTLVLCFTFIAYVLIRKEALSPTVKFHMQHTNSLFANLIKKTSIIIILCIFAITSGCSKNEPTSRYSQATEAATALNNKFANVISTIDKIIDHAKRIYKKELPQDTDWSKTYRYFDTSVFYKPYDDGLCEVWASGKIPIGKKERQNIIRLEPLQTTLKQAVTDNDAIEQAYILTKNHIALYYPFLSGISLFDPLIDFNTSFFPFSSVTPSQNPERKGRWIEPYLDATGKGYVASYSAPFYVENTFEGAVGIDIVLDKLGASILPQDAPLMLLSTESIPVAVTATLHALTGLEALAPVYYLEKIKKDAFVSSDKRLVLNQNPNLRTLGRKILEGRSEFSQTLGHQKYYVVSVPIPVINWHVVLLTPIS